MPRDGSGVYSPDWVNAAPNVTIESAKQNAMVADLVADANAARPVTAGGTGETTARLKDGTWRFQNTADTTKLLAFDLSGLTTATTRTQKTPNYNGTLASQAVGTAIASAASIDLGAALGSTVHITGTTTITALGTADAGIEKTVIFDGVLTLTHNATSLILPGGANVVTTAADIAVFLSEGSGNWRCINYARGGQLPFVNGFPAMPVATASAVGEMRSFTAGSGVALALPAGGTWAYSAFNYDTSTGTLNGSIASAVAAGGTTIAAGVGGTGWFGWCWRVL